MFKIITSLTMFATGLLANGPASETRNVSTFNKIEITDGVEIIFTQSDKTTLTAEATDGIGLSNLITESKNGTLKISCKGNMCETAKVYVSSPEIISMEASENSKIIMQTQIDTPKFSVALSSGATFSGNVRSEGEMALKAKSGAVFNIRVNAGSLAGSFHSGAKVNLSGVSGSTTIKTTDDALCMSRNLVAEKTSVKAADHSTVFISSNEEISVDVSGEAKVRYFGMPERVTMNPDAVATSRSTSRKSLITEY